MLPFTHSQFVFVFALYNGVIWPLQWLAQLLGLVLLALLARPSPGRHRAAVLLVAAMWLWTGVVYHIGFFSLINPIAPAFGAAFILEGLLLVGATWRSGLVFGEARRTRTVLGWAFLVYAVAIYPALGLLLGERVLDLPAFGLTPCPVALATFGLLLLSRGPARPWLFVIPLAWALVGGSAAVLLRMPQDWPLLVAPLLLAMVAMVDILHGRMAMKAS